MNGKRFLRCLQLAATGGVVFQIGGCAGGLAPVFLSLVESFTLDFLFRALVPVL
jgi:hypothetical protein